MTNYRFSQEFFLNAARGFQEARLLLTGAEIDIFTLLENDPLTIEEIAGKLGGNIGGFEIFMDSLAAIGYMIKKNERYQTEPSVAAILSSRSPDSILPMIRHGARLWETWSKLTDIILNRYVPAGKEKSPFSFDEMRSFIGAMHVVGAKTAPMIVKIVNPGEARKMIDVGGASGTYTAAFLAASPALRATLFDLPPVIEWARERLEKEGVLDRVTLVPGNFYEDKLPEGHDLAFISAIIHQNSPQQNNLLYQKTFNALLPGGRLIIRDHVMSPDRTQPADGALFAVNMLVNTMGGRTYTYKEIESGLANAGFVRIRQIHDQGMFSLVEAFKP